MKLLNPKNMFNQFTQKLGFFIFFICSAQAEKEYEKLTLLNGKSFQGVKILEVSHEKIRLSHTEGITSITPDDIPDEIRQDLGVSQDEVTRKLKEKDLVIQNKNNFTKFSDIALVLISGEVIQTFPEGAVLVSKARFMQAKEVPHNEIWIMEETIILNLDINHGLVSGDSLRKHSNWALRAGEVTYTTALGSTKTVRRYEMRSDLLAKSAKEITNMDIKEFTKMADNLLPVVKEK